MTITIPPFTVDLSCDRTEPLLDTKKNTLRETISALISGLVTPFVAGGLVLSTRLLIARLRS